MSIRILQGDCREVLATLPDASVQCCVTSPPYYGLRRYLAEDDPNKHLELGAEQTPAEYVEQMVAVFREVKRVIRDDGVCFLNLGDSYAANRAYQVTDNKHVDVGNNGASRVPDGLKPKDLLGTPWRVAFALQADGWWLRSDIIWAKPNPMPESVQGSHFSRHMVTISDYERLSGLPYVDERAGDDWAGDMPDLSQIEVPRGKAPLSAEREGQGNGSRSGGTSGRAGAAARVCAVGTGQEEPSYLSDHPEGQGNEAQDKREISNDGAWEAKGSREAPSDKGFATQDRANEACERRLCQVGKDGGKEATGLCEAKGRDSSKHAVYGRDVVGSGKATQEPLLLLSAAQGSDPRPRDPAQQGRQARSEQHRSSVPGLQLKEEQQADSSRLVGCPGCDKCAQHNGYILHLSAGRPTSAHEHVFLLAKRERYFFDAEAVREQFVDERMGNPGAYSRTTSKAKGANNDRQDGGFLNNGGGWNADGANVGRNIRNVWTIATQPFSDAHFACMAPGLAERCIKAGTSERGCCAKCGAPWVRQVERETRPNWQGGDGQKHDGTHYRPNPGGGVGNDSRARVDRGWQPSCACNAAVAPCAVLDPFGGAGTTALVADRLGRNAILIELNQQYCDLARNRLTKDAGLFAEVAA